MFRYTKFCDMWNHIRKSTILIPFPSFYAGKYLILPNFHLNFFPDLVDLHSCAFFDLNFVICIVIGMAANVGMFTSSSDPRVLYHRMILLTSTQMQMHIRSLSSCSHIESYLYLVEKTHLGVQLFIMLLISFLVFHIVG